MLSHFPFSFCIKTFLLLSRSPLKIDYLQRLWIFIFPLNVFLEIKANQCVLSNYCDNAGLDHENDDLEFQIVILARLECNCEIIPQIRQKWFTSVEWRKLPEVNVVKIFMNSQITFCLLNSLLFEFYASFGRFLDLNTFATKYTEISHSKYSFYCDSETGILAISSIA